MEKKVVIIGIFIKDRNAVPKVNAILSEYAPFILGRLGIPYREQGLNIISIIIDAPQNDVNALSGKLGRIDGVSSKTMQSK